MTQPLKAKLVSMLEVVYPELDCDFLAEELLATMGLEPNQAPPPAHQNNWDESDVVLITYADTVQRSEENHCRHCIGSSRIACQIQFRQCIFCRFSPTAPTTVSRSWTIWR